MKVVRMNRQFEGGWSSYTRGELILKMKRIAKVCALSSRWVLPLRNCFLHLLTVDSSQQPSPYVSLSIYMFSVAFSPLTVKNQITEHTSSGVYKFTGNSIAPDYLTRTSHTRSPWNLVSVFQNSNYNISAFFSIARQYSWVTKKMCITFRTTLVVERGICDVF